jgi:hypothetical protein
MNDSVVAIVSAFFVIGITVGIIVVVALSTLRADRRGDPGDPLDYGPRGSRESPPDRGWDDAAPDDHLRWPGGADSDFSSRQL